VGYGQGKPCPFPTNCSMHVPEGRACRCEAAALPWRGPSEAGRRLAAFHGAVRSSGRVRWSGSR